MVARTAAAASSARDPWYRALAGFAGFLEMCEDTRFRRVVLEEGPAALGWQRWRELDEPFGIELIEATLRRLADAEIIRARSVGMLARMLLGALSEAAMTIAGEDAAKRRASRRAAEETFATMLGAFRVPPSA